MNNTCARLGWVLSAVGIGLALGSTPGIASADGLDFQISIDGYDLLPTAGNSATATSGMGDIAIAFGNGATASAPSGLGNFAFADGANAAAFAGGGNYNTAMDIGNNTTGLIPIDANSSIGPVALAGAGNNDIAIIIGGNNETNAGGDFLQTGYDSSHDVAFIFNPFGSGDDVLGVGVSGENTGNYDLGGILFEDNVVNDGATGADHLYDVVTPFGTERSDAASVGVGAATALAAPADAYSDIVAAVNGDFAAGQAGFASALTDFGSGDFGGGLAGVFEGIDDYSLIAPENVIIGTAYALADEPVRFFTNPSFGVPDSFADGMVLTQQIIQTGENSFAEVPTYLASGDYPTAVLEALQGTDFLTVIPLETYILSLFAS